MVNSLPNDKILDWAKLKAFADHKLNAVKIFTSVINSVENVVGNGENTGHQHFLLPQCF